ncbi:MULTISPECIES: autotransporter domain-containing protein [Chlamydia]|uniref:Autotransporter domain-containing protein n=1 Tax=Chlamydia crocodili TaxID=2766982 RepID=A0ABX8CGC4_9CHLA|nr:autotransporter domain-containing protein [Chlamydia crocodili]QVE48835.1 autotransporter domain-containing protein [Chlamydia crocodili]
MKYPVCWFLSSGLIASTSLCFSAATEEILTSENSFNGNDGTNATFTTRSTSNNEGTIYRCSGDICIAYAGKGTPLTTSCFTQTAGDLTFIGNWRKLCFENITTDTGNPKPAAIDVTAEKTLLISGFSSFSCSYCPPSQKSAIQAAGAIKSVGEVKFENTFNVLFQKNQSKENGGAINCKAFSLTGVTGTANFTDNQSVKSGGAIYATGTTTISSNNKVFFTNNHSATNCSGGAINCSDTTNHPELKLENNKNLIFSDNITETSGGAIYADKLTITSGGPTLFSNNSVHHTTSPKGGAICLKDSAGECSLSANLGDITFVGNTIVADQKPTRNSIDLGTDGKFTQLRAKDGFGIFFYDPVTSSGTQATSLTINQSEGNSTYTGKIVFSGEKLTPQEKQEPKNLNSTLKQPVTLSAGSLILKDGVTLEAKSFTQTGGSVVMDLGTTLQTPNADGDSITLTNLFINVASLGNGGVATPAKIKATTTGKKVTINSVSFVDDNGNGYDYPILATNKPFTGIEITAATASTPDIPAQNLTNYVPPTHYGYQGNWTVTWAGTGDTKTATLIWNKTGYAPSPERRGTLVPNTLWGAFSDVRAIQNLMEVNANGSNYHRGFWVSGLANFLHKSGTATKLRFRHDSAGYLLGVFNQTPSEDIFSAAFGQLFGRDKDYLVSKNTANIYTGSIYYQHISSLAAWERLLTRALGLQVALILDAQLTYSHASNEIKTNAPGTVPPQDTIYSQVKGDWGNDCIAVELGATAPIELGYAFFDTYAPFMKVQFVYAHQEDFKEHNNDRGRHFENSHLTNVSLPIGIRYEKSAKNNRSSYNLTLTYIPDIVRSNPNCTTSLLSNPTGAIWTTTATNLARQAFAIRAGNYKSFSKNFEIFSQFSFELRDSSRTYNVDLGSKIQF